VSRQPPSQHPASPAADGFSIGGQNLCGFTLPIFTDIWNLSGAWAGLVRSAALAGSLAGSLVLGRAADRVVPSLLSEYLPPQRRGRFAVRRRAVGVRAALNISYYGLPVWLPSVLAGKEFDIDVYLLLALSALTQFAGYAAAIDLVDAWGRKWTLAAFLLLGGLSAFAFAAAESPALFVASLFFVSFFNVGAPGVGLPPSPPSSSRCACGRAASASWRARERPSRSPPTSSAGCRIRPGRRSGSSASSPS
jgi:hypothetical protein